MSGHSNASIQKVLAKAADACQSNGARLTEKRKLVLGVLLEAGKPVSAYEVADNYNRLHENSMAPMSIYRMLDFLVGENLAHKLRSANKYVACSHIACDHQHEIPQFLICRNCEAVKEISVKKSVIDSLREAVSKADYSMGNSQLEIDCLCKACAESESKS